VPKDQAIAAAFAGLHMVMERVMVVAILLHVAGALKHHFIDRDSTLRRMLPGTGPGTGTSPISPAYSRQHPLIPALSALAILIAAFSAGIGAGFGRHEPQINPPPTALPQTASDWTLASGSSLDLTITLFGSLLTGSFTDWSADITFTDPTQPGPAGQVVVTINIATLTLGSVSRQAMGPDYFDVERFPTASFTAALVKTATGYTATGPLTIRDQSVATTLPFTLTISEGTATMTANLSLNRLDFGVGASLPDESTLGFAVDLSIALEAQHRR